MGRVQATSKRQFPEVGETAVWTNFCGKRHFGEIFKSSPSCFSKRPVQWQVSLGFGRMLARVKKHFNE